MALPTAVSPATTYCSELEYLIALQSDEICSEVRRSQRLVERQQSSTGNPIDYRENLSQSGAGSPQLFTETDAECSQLPPNRVKPQKTKRAREQDVEKVDAKRRRSSRLSQSSCRPKNESTNSKSHLQNKTAPIDLSSRYCNTENTTSHLRTGVAMDLSFDVVSKTTELTAIPPKRGRSRKMSKSEQKPAQQTRSTGNAKPPRQASKTAPRTRTTKSKKPEAHSWPQLPFKQDLKRASECSMGISAEPQPRYCTLNNSYVYQPYTIQAMLPDVYPPHFVHQLPPQPVSPKKDLSEMCPTPENTPGYKRETLSRSPSLRTESPISSNPSLSDSVAEVFGTKKIREILKIQTPREYLVDEVHLPVIALILDVELERLRAVLGMAQRLSPDEMEQIANKPYELINISSSSEEE